MTRANPHDPGRTAERDVVLSIWLPAGLLALSRGLTIPVVPLFALSFDVSYGLVGLVLAAEGLGTLVFDVPAGVAIRRFGHRMPMLVGGVVIVASSLALAWARSLPEALVYRLVSGMGMALWNISRHTYVAETVRIQRRGRTNAVMGGIGRIAGFVGPAIGGLLAKAF